jgi:hypothetical protein
MTENKAPIIIFGDKSYEINEHSMIMNKSVIKQHNIEVNAMCSMRSPVQLFASLLYAENRAKQVFNDDVTTHLIIRW